VIVFIAEEKKLEIAGVLEAVKGELGWVGLFCFNFTSWTDRPWRPALPLQSALGRTPTVQWG
jgi:hypothetical protein